MTVDPKPSPLVILGLDAGVPEFLERWAREGYLPTTASILDRGCWGRTGGPDLLCEQGAWISLLSGVSLSQHGYYSFRQLKPGTYDLQTFTGRDADALPFWAHLRGRDKKVAIIDARDSYPLPGLPGIQLADWATHNPRFPPSAEPAELLEEVRTVFGSYMRIDEEFDSTSRRDRQIYDRLLERIEKKGALCRDFLARDRYDLVVVLFGESHTAGHQFWKYRPEARGSGIPGAENQLTNAIRDVYQAIDREMGRLLGHVPKDANVIIVSSTGLEDRYPAAGLIEGFCRQLGYQVSPKPSSLSLRPLDVIRHLVPDGWRAALSRHLPQEVGERLLADQFLRGTDWRKTIAFGIPSSYTSFVRVNLRGREPEGTVEPEGEYEALLDRLEVDLRQLIDPETDRPAVKQVTRVGELFGSGPPVSLPDLLVDWESGSRLIRRVVHPRATWEQRRPDFFRDSDHSRTGFVAAAGPAIHGRGEIGDVSVLDLAPTALFLMREPPPRRMAGRVIGAMTHG